MTAVTTARGPRTRSSKLLLLVMVLYALYTLVPLLWLLISATKTQAGLFGSFGCGSRTTSPSSTTWRRP